MAAYSSLTKNLISKSRSTTTHFVRFCSQIPDKNLVTSETYVSKSDEKPTSSSSPETLEPNKSLENPTKKADLCLFGLKYQGVGRSWRKTPSVKDLAGKNQNKDGDDKKTQDQQERRAKRLYSALVNKLKKKITSYAQDGKTFVDQTSKELAELLFRDIEHKKLSPALVKLLEKEIQKRGGLYQVIRDSFMETFREMEDEIKWLTRQSKEGDDDPEEMVDYVESICLLIDDARVLKDAAENPQQFLKFLRDLLILLKSRFELVSPSKKLVIKGVFELVRKFVGAEYVELSQLYKLLEFASPLYTPVLTKTPEPHVTGKPLKNGYLITVDVVGFTDESDLQVTMEDACVFVQGEAKTVKGDKVVDQVVPVPADVNYDPTRVTAQLIGGVVLVFLPSGSSEERKDCGDVQWGDVMQLIKSD